MIRARRRSTPWSWSSRMRTGPTRRRSTCCGWSADGSRNAVVSSLARTATTSSARSSASPRARRRLDHHCRQPALGFNRSPVTGSRYSPVRRRGRRRRLPLTSGNPFSSRSCRAWGQRGPRTVRDIVLARVARLTPHARRLSKRTSIAPPSLDAERLLAVCGEAADSVDECLASGVLAWSRTDASRFGTSFRGWPSRSRSHPAAVSRCIGRCCWRWRTHQERQAIARGLRIMRRPQPTGCRAPIRTGRGEARGNVGAYREAAAQYARALRYATI